MMVFCYFQIASLENLGFVWVLHLSSLPERKNMFPHVAVLVIVVLVLDRSLKLPTWSLSVSGGGLKADSRAESGRPVL